MIITVFMLIFIFLLAITAAYLLWSERHGQFLIFNFETNPKISTLFVVTSVALLVIAILGLFIVFNLSKEYNFITLILGAGAIFVFSLSFIKLGA